MPAYGISTYLRGRLNGTLCGTPYVLTSGGVQLHTGFPSTTGLLHPSAIGQLLSTSFVDVNGVIESTSGLPYVGVSNEQIQAYSVWDGLDTSVANLLWIGPLSNPQQLAAGDAYTLNDVILPFSYGLAAN